jgi:hypothetical protein
MTVFDPQDEAWLVVVGFVTLVFLTGVWVLEVSYNIPVLRVVDIAVSSALTLLIGLIYYRQNDILDDQKEIAHMQTRILREQRSPLLVVTDWTLQGVDASSVSATGVDTPETDGDVFITRVINYGDSSATNAQVICLLVSEPTSKGGVADEDESKVETTPSTRLNEYTFRVNDLEIAEEYLQSDAEKGAVIPPRADDELILKGNTGVSIRSTGGLCPLARATRITVCQRTRIARIGFVLQYRTLHGQERYIELDPGYELHPDTYAERDTIDLDTIRDAETCDVGRIVEQTDWDPPTVQGDGGEGPSAGSGIG